MEDVLENFFNLVVFQRYWPLLLSGLIQTVLLSAIAIPLGLVGGFGLAMLGTSPNSRVRKFAIVYVDLLRAFPPLVLLILISTGLPHFGVRLSPLMSVVIALLLNASAYYGEIFRAGFLSVPKGTIEAARATGMSYLQMVSLIRGPLAARNVLPDLLSNTLELVKLTSIAAVVTFVELTQAARVAQGLSFNATPIIAAAVLYLLLLWPLVRAISRLERRALAR